MNHYPWMALGSCAVVMGAIVNTPAFGQTDAGDLFRPWPEDQMFEIENDALLIDRGHIEHSDTDFRLNVYESFGRWRLIDDYRINPTVGYEVTYLDIHTDDDILPTRLVDQSVGFGTPLGQHGDWFYGITGAIGYAGNNPFGDSSAYYGKGTFLVGRELGGDDSLVIGIDYNGNRSIYPDIPIPGFAYTKRLDPKILAVIGVPYTSVLWELNDRLTVEVIYNIPDKFDARVSYEFIDHWRLFANLENRIMPFEIEDDDDTERLFFEQSRIEAGVRWDPGDYFGLVAAVGYAFDQEFSTGWDSRDLDEVVEPTDEAYLRFAIEYRP